MVITHDYTILCEMARPEMGGKFIIIGMFPNGIGTPQIPFPLPMLTFLTALRADGPGVFKFVGKLSQLSTGEIVGHPVQGMIQTIAPGPIILPVAFMNPQFKAFGSYTWSLEFEGQDGPFVMEFPITHVQMPQLRFPPTMPRQ
jgi:hypothetical protein